MRSCQPLKWRVMDPYQRTGRSTLSVSENERCNFAINVYFSSWFEFNRLYRLPKTVVIQTCRDARQQQHHCSK